MTQCPRGYIMSADGVCQKSNGYSTGGLMRNTMRPSARRRRNINPDPQPMNAACQAALEHQAMCTGIQGTYTSPLNSNYMGCQCVCQPLGGFGAQTAMFLDDFFGGSAQSQFFCYCVAPAGLSACMDPGGWFGGLPSFGSSTSGGQGSTRNMRGGLIRRKRRR